MIQQIEITLPEYSRGFHLITDEIMKSLGELPRYASKQGRGHSSPIY